MRRLWVRLLLSTLRTAGVRWMTHRLRSGEIIRLPTASVLAESMLLDDLYEPAVQAAIISRLRPGMTFLDVGANAGFYTLKAATIVGPTGRVVAFEPNPVVREQLERNIKLNHFSNVLVMPIALSDRSGRANFYFPPAGYEAHGSLRENPSFKTAYRGEVEVDTLANVLDKLGNPPVHVLKIDAEEAELSVLRGAEKLLSCEGKPVVVFEAAEDTSSAFGHRVIDVLEHLVHLGFTLSHLEGGNWLAEPRCGAGGYYASLPDGRG